MIRLFIFAVLVLALAGSAASQVTSGTLAPTGTTTTEVSSPTLPDITSSGASISLSPVWIRRFEAIGLSPGSFQTRTFAPEIGPEELKRAESRRHYFMATYYLEKDEPARALGEFQAALEDAPDSVEIMIGIAEANLRSKNFDAARDIIDQVLQKDPTNVRALDEKARMLIGRSEETSGEERRKLLEQGISAYKAGLEVQPRNADLLRGLASAYFSLQDIDAIIETYKRIVEVNPRDTHALLVLGNVYLRTGKPKEALPYFQRVTDLRRGFAQGYVYLAQTYFELGRVNDALKTFKDAILVEPRNAELLRRFDLVLEELAKRKNGVPVLKQYERFAREYPFSQEINRLYAEKLVEAESFDAAIKQYEKVLKLDEESIETLVAMGRLYLQRGNFDEAVKHFSRAVEIDPEQLEVYDAIAVSLIGQKHRDKAIELYTKALERNPKAQRLYISLSVLYQQDQRTTEAVKVLEDGIAALGPQPDFYALIGQNYEGAGEPKKASEYFGKAYALSPGNSALFAKLLSVLVRQQDEAGATALIAVAAESFRDKKEEFRVLVGDTYFAEGKTIEAAAQYEQAHAAAPDKVSVVNRLVQVYNLREDYDKSLEVLGGAGEKLPEDEDLAKLKIDTYLLKKDYTVAVNLATALVARDPSSIDPYRILVDVLNKAGRGNEAIEAIEDARDRIGADEEVESLRAIALYQQKKYAEAEKAFRDLTRNASKNKDVHFYFLGSVYLDQKRFEAAENAFRKAIDANPNNDSALNALGYMFADNGVKLDESEELIRRALALNPGAPHILDSMGWVLFKKGKLDEALEYVEKAHRLMGDDAEILDHLGDISAAKGNVSQAIEFWRRSLALDESQDDVRAKIARQQQ